MDLGESPGNRTSFGTEAHKLASHEDTTHSNKSLTIQNVFCGRDAEIIKLEGIFRRAAASRSNIKHPNLVLVGGASGAGKSTLVSKLKDHLAIIEEEFFWINGKFEEGQQQQTMDIDEGLRDHDTDGDASLASSAAAANRDTLHPFTALVDAFSLFFQELDQEEPETLDEVKGDILEAVGKQGAILTSMIPSIASIVGEPPQAGCVRESQSCDLKRFHLVFQKFLQALASQVRTVVLVLDDIHCADAASLDLLHYLLTSELKHVLFIGTYRSSQVTEEDHRFNKWITKIQATQAQEQPEMPKNQPSMTVTLMELSAMDLETINTLISDVLGLEPKITQSLAHIIHTKTQGNAFFATQYLLHLNKLGLLWFDAHEGQWDWDEEAIRKEAMVTTSLIDFMRDKMSHSDVAPKILPVAACLGAKFSQRTLELVLEDISKIEALQQVLAIKAEDVPDLLKLCHKEGFIESCGNKNYTFTHDKMQEAALTLHPLKTMQQIRFEAGGALFRKLDIKELEEKLFVIVNLLNTSQRCSVSPFEIAQLNLEAAKKAKQMAAFGSAATYIDYAMFFLPPRHKNSNYDAHRQFLLETCSLGAEVEAAVGRMDRMKDYVDRVCRSSYQYTTIEQMRAQNVLIDCSANMNGQLDMALKYCLSILEELGCTFPRTVIGKGFKSVSGLLKSKAPRNIPKLDAVDNMSLMTDPAKVEAMRLLDRAATYGFLQENQLMFLMCTTRMARWTIRFGICDRSPAAHATLALVLMHVLGDYKAGVWHAELALLMSQKLAEAQARGEWQLGDLTTAQSRAAFIATGMVLYWTKPLSEYKDEMVQAYEVGMKVGDTESACWSAFVHIAIKFNSGTPLNAVEKLCRTAVSEMLALHKEETEHHQRIVWQMILNLMQFSEAEGTTELLGSAITDPDWLEKQQGGSKLLPHDYGHLRTCLCAYLGEYETGAKLAVERGDGFLAASPGSAWSITDPFMRGVCLYAAANTTKQRLYRQHGQKCRATVRSWVKKGNPTAGHQLQLLDAEHEACLGKRENAKVLYQQACTSASNEGFIQDAALANERMAQFLLSSTSPEDLEEGKIRLVRALSLYEEWGAKGKVTKLLTEHPNFSTSKVSKPSSTSKISIGSSRDISEGSRSCPLVL